MDEKIRKPDSVIREQLIPDNEFLSTSRIPLPNKELELERAIMESMAQQPNKELELERAIMESMAQQPNKEEELLERAIMESIEEFKEKEKQKRVEEMREITMRVEKLKYTVTEETTRSILLSIIQGYITNNEIANNEIANNEIANNEIANNEIANNEIANNEIANNEITNHDTNAINKAKQFIQELYSVPLSKNRKTAITEEVYTIIMSKLG